MKRLPHLILSLTLAAACWPSPAAAQTAELKPPPKRKYKYEGKVVTDYDKAKGQTMVLIQLMPVKDVEDPRPVWENSADKPRRLDRLGVTFFFTYAGQEVVTPERVYVGFLYQALDPHKYEDPTLVARIDGEKVELARMTPLSRTRVSVPYSSQPYTRQTLEASIPYEQFLRLANAKKVKMWLGKQEFDLSKDHLEAIRDLASRTVP